MTKQKKQNLTNDIKPLFFLRHSDLAVIETAEKGRGVIATKFIPKNTILETSPVIRLTTDETQIVSKTLLDTYVFAWMDPPYNTAIPLGIVTLVNHSANPNTTLKPDFISRTISISSLCDINPMEEITFDYDCDLWFEVH
jgi:SET domain-containing protein